MPNDRRRRHRGPRHNDQLLYVRETELEAARALLAREPGPPGPGGRGEGGAGAGVPSGNPGLTLVDASRGLPASPAIRVRVRALLGVLWYTGCRISEALSVRECDLDRAGGFLVLRNLKRRRAQTKALPLPPAMIEELVALGPAPGGRYFPWSRSRAFQLVSAALMGAGVERARAHPHALRHGLAVHALRRGVPLNVVQRALGHASVASTARYLSATGEDVRREFEGAVW